MLKISFILALILTVVSSIIVIKSTKKPEPPEVTEIIPPESDEDNQDNDKPKPGKRKLISLITFCPGSILMLTGILTNIILSISDTPYQKIFILMAVTLVSEYILMCLYHTCGKNLLKFCARTFAILSILQVTV